MDRGFLCAHELDLTTDHVLVSNAVVLRLYIGTCFIPSVSWFSFIY